MRMMDIQREGVAAKNRTRRFVYLGAGAVAVALITVGLSRLEPAAPSVERATVWIDTVKRGPLVRQVRGSGTLVPEEVRWIPAMTDGRVERILAQPGTVVTAETILMVLSNPEVALAADDAASAVAGAEAESINLKVQMQSQLLSQEAQAATVEASYRQAQLQAEANDELAKQGLIAPLTLKLSQVTASELAARARIEQKRLEIAAEAAHAQIAVHETRLAQLRAALRLKQAQRSSLEVRAGSTGVLQQLPVEAGQQISSGAILAKIAEPGRLKAEVRVPETQARDILVGQSASVDTRNGVVTGRVVRIDPAVVNGTVGVDVSLPGALPKGARPDLSIEGVIELERLDDVLHVGRPAMGQEGGGTSIFVLDKQGNGAARVKVRLGRSSVNAIEIIEGLNEGDQVILSDMTAWDSFDRVKLK